MNPGGGGVPAPDKRVPGKNVHKWLSKVNNQVNILVYCSMTIAVIDFFLLNVNYRYFVSLAVLIHDRFLTTFHE